MATKIKLIKFTKKETFIGFETSEQPRDANAITNEKNSKRSDLPRHADFERAMDKLKPHLLITNDFQAPKDCNGNMLQSSHFNDFFGDEDEEAERFGGLEMTGIIIHGKHAADGVQLFGTKTSKLGIIPVQTPVIPLKRNPGGYDYPLLDILDAQIDKLLLEASMFNDKKKHGAGVQTEAQLPPSKPDVNTTTGKNIAKGGKAVSEQGNLIEA